MREGEDVTVRGLPTKEVLNRLTILERPVERFVFLPQRLNNVFAQIAETMWVLSGRNDIEWLIDYADETSSEEDRLFQIVAFRTFSNIRTWRDLRVLLGGAPTVQQLISGAFEQSLREIKSRNGGLYTGAFILCATKAYGFDEKHRNHVALFKHMFVEQNLAHTIWRANSLEQLVRSLEAFPLMGPFMAYQTAIDLNYSALIEFSENEYTQAGPGALRGLKKAFIDIGDYSPAETILWMTEQQDNEFERLGLPFAGLFGRKLHAIDCQGLFCELDKYCREAAPELASNRSRIKARFSASSEALPLFFPPKWNLRPWSKEMPAITQSAGTGQLVMDFDNEVPISPGFA
jgi:hypothetical protein